MILTYVIVLLMNACVSVSIQDENLVVEFKSQWKTMVGSSIKTFEICVENGLREPLSVNKAYLGEFELPSLFGSNIETNGNPLYWWKIPERVKAQSCDEILLSLRESELPLEFTIIANNKPYSIVIPKYTVPKKRISDVVFNGANIVIKTESNGVPIKQLFINDEDTPFVLYEDGRIGLPYLVMAKKKCKDREKVNIKVIYNDEETTFAVALVQNRFMKEVVGADRRALKKLSADTFSFAQLLQNPDVCCYDIQKGVLGASLRDITIGDFENNKPSALMFCTGATSELYDLYGSIADCAYSFPFPALKFAKSKDRIKAEEDALIKAKQAITYRPLFWTAPFIKRQEMVSTHDEIISSFWMALALGVRGISAYLWRSSSVDYGMDNNPGMVLTWNEMIKILNNNKETLFPLVHYETYTYNDLIIHTAWNVGEGMRVYWRENDFEPLKHEKTFFITIPQWLNAFSTKEMITGENLPISKDSKTKLSAKCGTMYGVYWIQNDREGG